MAVEPLLATRAQRAFIATITIQAIAVLVMVAIEFRDIDEFIDLRDTRYKTVPCYLALFALAEIFEFLMAFDALRLRNIIQLLGLLIFHGALIVFAGIQIHETRTALVTDTQCDDDNCGTPLWNRIKPFLIATPCIIGASWFFLLFWVKQLYSEFGWAIFHVVGANPKMKTMYQYYQIMICLLKFDFFFFTGLLIIVLQRSSAEFGITIAAIPVVLVLLILCGLAVQREIKAVMGISLVLMLAALSYFLYKLVRFYEPSSRNQYLTTRDTQPSVNRHLSATPTHHRRSRNKVTAILLQADGMTPFSVKVDALSQPAQQVQPPFTLRVRLCVPTMNDARAPATLHGFHGFISLESVWSSTGRCISRVYQNGHCISSEEGALNVTHINVGTVNATLPESPLSRCRWLDPSFSIVLTQEIIVDDETLLFMMYELDRKNGGPMPSAMLLGYQKYRAADKGTPMPTTVSPSPNTSLPFPHAGPYPRPPTQPSLSYALSPMRYPAAVPPKY